MLRSQGSKRKRSDIEGNDKSTKQDLFDVLDSWMFNKGLTELHTHLMGMGSADFWVSRIIESYLPRVARKMRTDVYYPIDFILKASGFKTGSSFDAAMDLSLFEAMFFDNIVADDQQETYNLQRCVTFHNNVPCISNNQLVELLRIEDKSLLRSGAQAGNGPLRAMVRNWFEFLSPGGDVAHHSEILNTCKGQLMLSKSICTQLSNISLSFCVDRGHFTPGFYPQRFTMKDPIVEAFPSVLGILLNTTLHRYAKAGVQYVEYSVSCGDLLNENEIKAKKFKAMTSEVYSTDYFKNRAMKTPQFKTNAALRRAESLKGMSSRANKQSSQTADAGKSYETQEEETQENETEVDFATTDDGGMSYETQEEETEIVYATTGKSYKTEEEGTEILTSLEPALMSQSASSNPELAVLERLQTENSSKPIDYVAFIEAPEIPKMLNEGVRQVPPAWRQHINYFEKPSDQDYHFLAAFNRDSKVVYHKIRRGVWLPAASISGSSTANATAKPSMIPTETPSTVPSLSPSSEPPAPQGPHLTPRQANELLADIASDFSEMLLFLRSHETFLRSIDVNIVVPDLNISPNMFETLCEDGRICNYLKVLAQVLCQDEFVAKMYPAQLPSSAPVSTGLKVHALQESEHIRRLHPLVVGLDWVGDELGHPFCIFSHDSFIDLVEKWKAHNPKFGLRFHAGEGPIRPSSRDSMCSKVRLAFYLHMYILVEGIRLCHTKLVRRKVVPCIRIGHGVAFLYGSDIPAGVPAPPIVAYLKEFRTFLKDSEIVCELNPTSNHMLLSSTFGTATHLKNQRTLRMFLQEGVPVVLGTDDDGIWAIHKCRCHYHHVSVAAEYCQAIECGDIQSTEELEYMFNWGRKSAFSDRRKTEKDKEEKEKRKQEEKDRKEKKNKK